jgi:hypothetical protein
MLSVYTNEFGRNIQSPKESWTLALSKGTGAQGAAALMKNGKVLVAGWEGVAIINGGDQIIAEAELFLGSPCSRSRLRQRLTLAALRPNRLAAS